MLGTVFLFEGTVVRQLRGGHAAPSTSVEPGKSLWKHSAGKVIQKVLLHVQGGGLSRQSGGRPVHCLACGQDSALP